MKIMTLCHANRCRSMLLEAAIRNASRESGLSIEVYSGGINPDKQYGKRPPVGEIEQCRKFGLDISDHESKYISDQGISEADIILVSDEDALSRLVETFPDTQRKAYLTKEYVARKSLPKTERDLDEPWFPRNGISYRGFQPKSLRADYTQYHEMARLGKSIVKMLQEEKNGTN